MSTSQDTPQAPGASSFRERIHALLQSRWAFLWLFVLSFLENTVVLIAIEPLFVPAMLAKRSQALLIAAALLAGCLAGALCTYALASALFEPYFAPALERFGWMDRFEDMQELLKENGFSTLIGIGITPVPFQLGTVGAGLVGYSLPLFILAILIGRGVRYFGLALLVIWIGRRAERLLERYELEISIAFLVLFAGLVAFAVLA